MSMDKNRYYTVCARFGFRKTVTSKAVWIGAGSWLNDVDREPERVGEVDEGGAESNKEGVLCGSNDAARETNDKMRKQLLMEGTT